MFNKKQAPSTGKYDAFEVKSSMGGHYTFSEEQLNPENFVETRMAGALKHNEINKLTPEKYKEIMDNLGDRKVAYVDVKRASNNKLYANSDNIRTEDWDTEAKKIKGGHH